MRIAICDDNSACRGRVLDIATDYSEERKDAELVFEMFFDPKELLDAVVGGKVFDIFILDIVMPEMNGIALGKALRNNGANGKIVYLTSSEEYALDSFRVRAFDYLIKPITKEVFYNVMDELISSIHIKKDRVLVVKTKDGNNRITFDSILFAELSKRAIAYHLSSGKTLEGTTLRTTFVDAVGELLGDERFSMCGASMVVNLHHITSIENDGIIFSDNKRVFLGKKACRELRSVWNNYWINEGN